MTLDAKIRESIQEACSKASQPETVANMMCAWFEEIVRGNHNLNNQDDVYNRLEEIFSAIKPDDEFDIQELTLDALGL